MLAYLVGVFFLVLAGWVLAVVSGWGLPYDVLMTGLVWLKTHPWEDLIIAAVFLILGVFPFLKPRQRQAEPTFITLSRLGEVRVTYGAMREIMVRSAQALPGIRNVQPKLKQREDGIEVLVYTELQPEVVIPEISEQLQSKIKEDLEHYTGTHIAEVKVLVRGSEPARRTRVR